MVELGRPSSRRTQSGIHSSHWVVHALRVTAIIGVVRFDDDALARVVGILEHDVNIVIGLALDADDAADDLIDLEFVLAAPVIPRRTAVGRKSIQGSHRRFGDPVDPDTLPDEEVGDSGRIQWVSGRPGDASAYAGTDVIIARDGRCAVVYLFSTSDPEASKA